MKNQLGTEEMAFRQQIEMKARKSVCDWTLPTRLPGGRCLIVLVFISLVTCYAQLASSTSSSDLNAEAAHLTDLRQQFHPPHLVGTKRQSPLAAHLVSPSGPSSGSSGNLQPAASGAHANEQPQMDEFDPNQATPTPVQQQQKSEQQQQQQRAKRPTLYACEEHELNIECPLGEWIQLIRANYGRFSIQICNDQGQLDWKVNCMSPASFQIISNSCQAKQSCQLLASNSIFGDACPGTQKYLEVHYQCVTSSSNVSSSFPSGRLIGNQLSPMAGSATATTSSSTITSLLAGIPPSGPTQTSQMSIKQSNQLTNSGRPLNLANNNINKLANPNVIPQGSSNQSPNSEMNAFQVSNQRQSGGQNRWPNQVELPDWMPKLSSVPNQPPLPAPQAQPPSHFLSPTMASSEQPAKVGATQMNVGPSGEMATVCPETVWRQTRWPTTEVGRVAYATCPGLTRSESALSMSCLEGGIWANRLQAAPHCQSIWLRNLTQRLEAGDSPLSIMTELSQRTRPLPAQQPLNGVWSEMYPFQLQPQASLFGDDLITIRRIVGRLVEETRELLGRIADDKQRISFAREMVQSLADLVSNLAHNSHLDSWQDLSLSAVMGERQRSAGQLASGLDSMAILVAGALGSLESQQQQPSTTLDGNNNNNLEEFVKLNENVYIAIRTHELWPSNKTNSLSNHRANLELSFPNEASLLGSSWASLGQKLNLYLAATTQGEQSRVGPGEPQTEGPNNLRVAFVMVRGLGRQMDPQMNEPTNSQINANRRQLVNSNLMSVHLVAADSPSRSGRTTDQQQTQLKVDLAAPVELVFRHLNPVGSADEQPKCAFWDSRQGDWLTDGCRLTGSNRSHSSCACNQLASFGLLAHLSELDLSSQLDQELPNVGQQQNQHHKVQLGAAQSMMQQQASPILTLVDSKQQLQLAQLLEAQLFPAHQQTRPLMYLSCLLSALLIAIHLFAKLTNRAHRRRLLGAIPSQPPPALLIANSQRNNEHPMDRYVTTKQLFSTGAPNNGVRRSKMQLSVPMHILSSLLMLQILLVILIESQNYLTRNQQPANWMTEASLPVQLSGSLDPIGWLTWIPITGLYYLSALFSCWLLSQLVILNLELISWPSKVAQVTVSPTGSSIYHQQNLYGTAVRMGDPMQGVSPDFSFSSSLPATSSTLTNGTICNGVRLMQNHPNYHQGLTNQQQYGQNLNQKLRSSSTTSSSSSKIVQKFISHLLPVALVALVCWLSAGKGDIINSVAFTLDRGVQLAMWPLLGYLSFSSGGTTLLIYLPFVCLMLAISALVSACRAWRELISVQKGRGGTCVGSSNNSPANSSSGSSSDSSSEVATATAKDPIGAPYGTNQGDQLGLQNKHRLSLLKDQIQRARLQSYYLFALLVLHSINWLSIFVYLQQTFTRPSGGSIRLLHLFAFTNIAIALMITFVGRKPIRRAAQLTGLTRFLRLPVSGSLCPLVGGPQDNRGVHHHSNLHQQHLPTHPLYKSATIKPGDPNGALKVSPSSQSLFLLSIPNHAHPNHHQLQKQQQQQQQLQMEQHQQQLYGAYSSGSSPAHLQYQQLPGHIYDSVDVVQQHHRAGQKIGDAAGSSFTLGHQQNGISRANHQANTMRQIMDDQQTSQLLALDSDQKNAQHISGQSGEGDGPLVAFLGGQHQHQRPSNFQRLEHQFGLNNTLVAPSQHRPFSGQFGTPFEGAMSHRSSGRSASTYTDALKAAMIEQHRQQAVAGQHHFRCASNSSAMRMNQQQQRHLATNGRIQDQFQTNGVNIYDATNHGPM